MAKAKSDYRGLTQADSGIWFIRSRSDGKDRIVSTFTKDREEAEKVYDRLKSEVQLIRSVDDRMDEILEQLRNMPELAKREEARQRLLRKLQGAAEAKVLISAAWAEWRKGVKKTTEITIAGYSAVWKRFALWLGEQHPSYTHLAQINRGDAKAYSHHLWASRITVTTYKLHLSFLCRVWRELKNEAGLIENVWTDFVKEKMDKEAISRKKLSAEQLATLVNNATGELRDMLRLGFWTGLRLKDVALLDASKFDAASAKLRLIPFKTRRKGEKAIVEIPIQNGHLLKLLNNPGPTGFYFPEMAKRYKAMPSDVSRIIQNHFETCGIKTSDALTEDSRRKRAGVIFGFHSLRYSFVSVLAGKGVPQHVLGSLVGHSSPQMTLSYSESDDTQRSKAIGKMPKVIEI